MKRFYFVIIIILFNFINTFAKDSTSKASTLLFITPTTFIEPNPFCRVGVEKYIVPKTIATVEIGYGKIGVNSILAIPVFNQEHVGNIFFLKGITKIVCIILQMFFIII